MAGRVVFNNRDYDVITIGGFKMAEPKQLNYMEVEKMRFSLDALIKCAKRELAMRQRAYPKWVEQGRMDEREALIEIAKMENIKDILIQLQTMIYAATGEKK